MDTIKNVYISGLGAIGSSYAGCLYKADPGCIKVVADEERIERYRRNGISINNEIYDFEYVRPGEKAIPADLIIVAVKQHHLEQCIKDIGSFVGKDTIILSLLNGISSEEILGRRFGMEKILYAFCVGIDAVREGTNTSFTKTGKIVFGEKENTTPSKKVEAVRKLFDRAHIPYSVPGDMIREQWWKFMLNVGINQVSAILKATYGVFRDVKEARELMIMASKEVIRLAEVLKIGLTEKDIDEYLEVIATLSPGGKTSMLQDIEAGRKTEVEIFAGTVIELGRRYNVATPVNEVLYRMIRVLERQDV